MTASTPTTTPISPAGNEPRGHVPFFVPLLNPLMAAFLRVGVPMGAPMYLLTVRGRTTGADRTTPVALFELDGERYLFSTFGETQWVRNLRVSGRARLARRGESLEVDATPLDSAQAAPVLRSALRRYLNTPMRAFLGRYYASSADGPDEDFVELARRHPVFHVSPVRPDNGRIDID
jgi:deazaflavin-dependent oxidoreductase (nitroreductase family)